MDIESSQVILNQGIAFLVISGGIFILVIMGFLAKLIYDLSKLAQNANDSTVLINTELKPMLKELNKTIKTFNEIIQSTGEGVGNVKLGIENIFTKTKTLSGNLLGGFINGFLAIYTLFSKKKK